QSKTEDRNTATTIGFDRVHHRCVEDADWPVDLVDHHVPKVCVRSFLALEVGIHGGRKREGHDGVVANDLAALPRIPPVVESMIELLLRCVRLDQPSEHLRLVLVGRGIRPVAARPNVAYRHGHAERIGKRHILPAVVWGRYAYVVDDLLLENAIAVFGGET